MKKNLLILLLIISSSSKSHKLLTDIMKKSVSFDGFGFAANSIDNPDGHSIYNLSELEINAILIKINAQEAIKQFTLFSQEPEALDPNIPQQEHEYSIITDNIPHSNKYWARSYQFQCEEGVSNCIDYDEIGEHHGGGVFNRSVADARLAAQYVCSNHPIDYGQILIPYFLGPETFSYFEIMMEYPYVEIPTLGTHHSSDAYTIDQHIIFKCVFKL